MPAPERPPRDPRLLVVLQERVARARADVMRGRSSAASHHRAVEQQRLCRLLAGALEAYAAAASDCGVPLPYRYRDEMRLYRSMYPSLAGPSGGKREAAS